jgi:DNA-binding NarL/FixJ family response regulator
MPGTVIAQTKNPRVLLADDHPEILAQTGSVLSGEFEIVGSVANGMELIRMTHRLNPDVVVLDITMPGLNGIQVARHLQHVQCRSKIVFLSVHEDPDYVRAALGAGGSAYVVKARLASDLIDAIHEVLRGNRFLSPTIPSAAELQMEAGLTISSNGRPT